MAGETSGIIENQSAARIVVRRASDNSRVFTAEYFLANFQSMARHFEPRFIPDATGV
jgi:hypothetical protein